MCIRDRYLFGPDFVISFLDFLVFFSFVNPENLVITGNPYLPKKLSALIRRPFLDEKMNSYVLCYMVYTIQIIMIPLSFYWNMLLIQILFPFELGFYLQVQGILKSLKTFYAIY